MSFILILLTSGPAKVVWAGPGASGGGDVVILPNDDIVIADPFIVTPGKKMELSPQLREELLRAGRVLKAYGADDKFIADNVLSRYVEYRYVDRH